MRILAAVAVIGVLNAQSEPGTLRFEVASIRPVATPARPIPAMTGGPGSSDPERISYTVPMLRLLQSAFGLDQSPDQVSGPGWIGNEWYSLTAKLPPGATREQVAQMLQALLVDRFGLRFHRDSRVTAGYELLVGKDGPRLKPTADTNATGPAAGTAPSPTTFDKEGFPIIPAGTSAIRFSATDNGGTMHVTARGQSISALIVTIVTSLNDGKRVVDKTGLTGKYDFKMDLDGGGGFRRPGLGPRPIDDPMGPDIFTALDKYLGLKLQKAQIPVDTVVIDHLDKTPSEN